MLINITIVTWKYVDFLKLGGQELVGKLTHSCLDYSYKLLKYCVYIYIYVTVNLHNQVIIMYIAWIIQVICLLLTDLIEITWKCRVIYVLPDYTGWINVVYRHNLGHPVSFLIIQINCNIYIYEFSWNDNIVIKLYLAWCFPMNERCLIHTYGIWFNFCVYLVWTNYTGLLII